MRNLDDAQEKSEPAPKHIKLDPFSKSRNVHSSSNEKISRNIQLKREFENYELEKIDVCDQLFNHSSWWKDYESKYPFLSRFAKYIMVVPGSLSESERIFPIVSEITRKDRARLNPDIIEAQVIVSDGIKKNFKI